MTRTTFRRLLALTVTTGLAAALAACGPDDAQQSHAAAPLLSQAALQTGWSMDDLAGVDPAFLAGDDSPLPHAMPMRAAYRGHYDYAPAYDYGPDPYDDGYYAEDAGADDYQWLALASALGGMLGDAPPDYGFGYDGVQPWAWETGDRYLRYAEPIYGGDYRYYYYEPDSYTPYLVSDPYYSYGYRDDRLVAIYDRSGRLIDARRAERQRRAAQDYYARARQMYVAAHREPHVGVAAPVWQRNRDEIARQPQLWQQAKAKRVAWQQWDAKNQPRLHRDWAGEALVRREAERSFSGWQKAKFKTPAPKFYSPRQRQVQLQKVAEIRRDTQAADSRQARQRQVVQQRHAVQQRNFVEQGQQAGREVDARRVRGQQQIRAKEAGPQRQAEARPAKVQQHTQALQHQQQARKAAQRRQTQVQVQRAKAQQASHAAVKQHEQGARQRQQQAQRATQQHQQQALRAAAQRRQQAAREHQLEAQRGTQQRQAQRAAQQQARHATEQRQAQRAQQAQQQAQRAARQQAQANQAAQRQAQQARFAQKQAPAPQAQRTDARGGGNGHGHGGKKG